MSFSEVSKGQAESNRSSIQNDMHEQSKAHRSEGIESCKSPQPAIYIPHGGGPWPFLEADSDQGGAEEALALYLRALPEMLPENPGAILVISAHWEEALPSLMTKAHPELYYDYYGFPEHTYRLQWKAKGDPDLLARIRELLCAEEISFSGSETRNYDHGCFIPLMLCFPEPQMPVVQLSLKRGLDPKEHIEIGRALRPLRSEGVLILGSGMSYHNMRGFFTEKGKQDSREFHEWLQEILKYDEGRRTEELIAWKDAPKARECHPREEHLLPLMVAAGAAGSDPATLPFLDEHLGVLCAAVHFSDRS